MLFNSATEYAIRGLGELALRAQDGKCVMLDDLVSDNDLPREFLAKIFQKLVHAGILSSIRGRGGGFTLARAADKITLLEILETVEDRKNTIEKCVVGLERCNDAMPCPQHDHYKPVRKTIRDYLGSTTVKDLAESLASKRERKREDKSQSAQPVQKGRAAS